MVVMMFSVVMMAAVSVFVVMVLMLVIVMMAAMSVFIMMVFVLVIVMTAVSVFIMMVLVLVIVMVMMAMFMLLVRFRGKAFKLGGKGVLFLDRGENIRTLQILPIGGDDGRIRVFFQQRDRLGDFLLVARVRKDDAACILHLIGKELAEIFQVHFALFRVDDGTERIQLRVGQSRALHGADHVRQFSDAGRLDDNAVGRVFRRNLFERFGKISDERAADTAGVHLRDLNPRVLQKAAVYADLAELVFDEHDLFALIDFLNELFNERRFPCAQKS